MAIAMRNNVNVMGRVYVKWVMLGLICMAWWPAMAQNARVELGSTTVPMNRPFTITVSIENSRISQFSSFPDIPGFRKGTLTNGTRTNIVNGKVSSVHSYEQQYFPTRQGTFKLSPFTIEVNGIKLRSSGATITVTSPNRRAPSSSPFGSDPFEDFFRRNSAPVEYVEVEDDAFLALSISDDTVYRGEGVNVTLALYVSEDNRAPLRYHNMQQQLTEIRKKLNIPNAWQESVEIQDIAQGNRVTINGVRHNQYRIFQATFFPLNTEPLVFPEIALEMGKDKVAKRRGYYAPSRQQGFKTYYSRPKTVVVKELPPHPLREKVNVGEYRLTEALDKENLETGQSFSYDFQISGRGNIAGISQPTVVADDRIDFYPPSLNQNIRRSQAGVRGSSLYSFYGTPNDPGTYNLGDFMQWIFFNPKTARYDTLKPNYTLTVTGQSRRDLSIQSSDEGDFYQVAQAESNQLQATNGGSPWLGYVVSALLLTLIILIGVFTIHKP